jgi:hypothetical protein
MVVVPLLYWELRRRRVPDAGARARAPRHIGADRVAA